jgi:diguanylate cyclase (GGDEF)-like protein
VKLCSDRRLRVAVLFVVVAVLAVGMYAGELARVGAPAGGIQIPWWALALVFLVVEVRVVHLQFRSEAHSLSFSEVGLMLGLFFASPGALLLAQFCGAGVALFAVRRQRPLKIAFNLAQFGFGSCLALLIFHGLGGVGATHAPVAWAVALVGAGVASVAGVALVSAAIAAAEGRSTLREFPKMALIALVGSLATAGLGLAAIELLKANVWAIFLLLIPAAGSALAYRAYGAERQRHRHLEFLYESMRSMQGAQELQTAVRDLLAAARNMLSADFAAIVFLPSTTAGPALRSVSGLAYERLLESTELAAGERLALDLAAAEPRAILLARGRSPHALDAYLAEHRLEDGILTALRAEGRIFGLLLVGNRAGDLRTFTGDDCRLFETFAGHAGVLLENDRVKEQLRYQAFHDALTGLPNRLLFAKRVEEALTRGRTGNAIPTVLFIDLDDFKTINDTLGHSAGDQLLIAVTERFRTCVRPGDTAARLGGDEFAILLENADTCAAEQVARRIVAALRAPFTLQGREMSIHASIGIARGERNAATLDVLLRNADVAMYSVKSNGKRGHALYEPEMHTRIKRRHELSAALERAVERAEINIQYQPIVSLADGRTIALEALARWHHPERGIVLPGSFIPIAEETGLMSAIGRTVLSDACLDLRTWQSAFPELSISVNLSPSEIQNPRLADEVESILDNAGIAPDHLILEITESGAMRDPEATLEALQTFRGMGIRLALDDFGTGHSSLSHLRDFPIDILKIAKPFVDRIGNERFDTVFLDAILKLAGALDLDVVAEGIETREQAQTLRLLNCRLGQGYHFARPLDRAAAEEHLRATASPTRPRELSAA